MMTATQQPRKIYSPKELSMIVKRSEQTIRRLFREGRIRGEQPSPKAMILIPEDEARRVFPLSFSN